MLQVRIAALAASLLLAACAATVQTTPVTLDASSGSATAVRKLRQNVTIELPTRYTRTLFEGSRWRAAGAIPQGLVYRPVDTVLTIEGSQVHEAYLVLSGGNLVGFYLPAESSYSALSKPVPLTFGDAQ